MWEPKDKDKECPSCGRVYVRESANCYKCRAEICIDCAVIVDDLDYCRNCIKKEPEQKIAINIEIIVRVSGQYCGDTCRFLSGETSARMACVLFSGKYSGMPLEHDNKDYLRCEDCVKTVDEKELQNKKRKMFFKNNLVGKIVMIIIVSGVIAALTMAQGVVYIKYCGIGILFASFFFSAFLLKFVAKYPIVSLTDDKDILEMEWLLPEKMT